MPEISFTDFQQAKLDRDVDALIAKDKAAYSDVPTLPPVRRSTEAKTRWERKSTFFKPNEKKAMPKPPVVKTFSNHYGSDTPRENCQKRPPYCRCNP